MTMPTAVSVITAALLWAGLALPAAAQEATQETAQEVAQDESGADPAVWGPYAQWVGRTFERQGSSEYGAHRITIAWEEPGKVMVETGYLVDGKRWYTYTVVAGTQQATIPVAPKPGPKGAWNIVDAENLESNKRFGYQTTRRVTGAQTFEEATLRSGGVVDQRVYLDIASAQYQAVQEAKAVEEARKRAEAVAARRAAGVPAVESVPVPAERVLAYQEPLRGGSGMLRVTRGKTWGDGICYLAVYINDRLAARMVGGETATFRVPAGELRIGVGGDPAGRGTCSMGRGGVVEHLTPLGKGEALHVYYQLDSGLHFSEALLDPAAP